MSIWLLARFIFHQFAVTQHERRAIGHRLVFPLLSALALLLRSLPLFNFSTTLFEGVLILAHGLPSCVKILFESGGYEFGYPPIYRPSTSRKNAHRPVRTERCAN